MDSPIILLDVRIVRGEKIEAYHQRPIKIEQQKYSLDKARLFSLPPDHKEVSGRADDYAADDAAEYKSEVFSSIVGL